MIEGAFYGIWNGKKAYWVHLNNNLGLFAAAGIGLSIIRAHFHNIEYNLGEKGSADYQIRRLGENGLPTGEPLND
jgi:hypothetical protein